MTSNLVSNPVNDGKVTSRSANIHVMKSDLDQVLLSNINNEIVGGADNDINTGKVTTNQVKEDLINHCYQVHQTNVHILNCR
ncbi:unnamed protein product [Rotaria socialis]|uniref:Uncharacterized protein n=1 Tax=Rotaria socialis TaxID=392032 RepID=A0A821HZJ9_9BILA|nr:unnamed protein product [Rotaria socialis]